jgi:hypothetical protein
LHVDIYIQKKRAKKPRDATARESLTKIELFPVVPAMQDAVTLVLIIAEFEGELMVWLRQY